MVREQAIQFLMNEPYKLGHLVGFTKLNLMHNKWIKEMAFGKADATLQAHRGSYKTTCVSIALALVVILRPSLHTAFVRKTDSDVKEIIKQTQNILKNPHTQYFVASIYGTDLKLITDTQSAITTNLGIDIKGSPQITGMGTSGSITGKHYDLIFTDDIVNIADRKSKAERDRTKLVYQELQNIKNRDGRIFNTGTPWHIDDCFTLMPEPQRFDCYATGMMSDEQIEELKKRMTPSLFCANYELRHIPSDDVIFSNPQVDAEPSLAEQGITHIDASYGGSDYTAVTICNKRGDSIYMFGKLYSKHIDDCLDDVLSLHHRFCSGRIYCEDNGDKGYLAKEIRRRGERVTTYHEPMNKHLKITSYLKFNWKDVWFVEGTDKNYINQICDYTEDAEHDDAPDSASCCVRLMWNKNNNKDYEPILS